LRHAGPVPGCGECFRGLLITSGVCPFWVGPGGGRGWSVLKTGKPYADLGADSCTRRESPDARQDYLMRQLRKLNPGYVITITPAETA
jgi:hypothetical protein